MTDSDPEPSRVQSLRTYGKRRQSPTLNPETYSVGPDEGSLENDTPGFPVVSASADEEASDSTNYHWKAMLTRIDAGKEDGKLLFPVSSSSGFTRALTPLTDEHRTPLLPDSVEETLPVILKSVPVPLSGPDQGSNILINASIDLPVAPPTHNDQPEPSDAEVGSGSRECREGKKKNNPRLTKQERLEMEKETARVKVARRVMMQDPQTEWKPLQRPMTAWELPSNVAASDPDAIELFTSSPSSKSEQYSSIASIEGLVVPHRHNELSSVYRRHASYCAPRQTSPTRSPFRKLPDLKTKLLDASDSESDNPPSVEEVIAQSNRKSLEKKNVQNARKLKLEAMDKIKAAPKPPDDDDDLEIEPAPVLAVLTAKGSMPNALRKSTLRSARQSLLLHPSRPSTPQPIKRQENPFADLFAMAQSESTKSRAAKEQDWVARGGQLVDARKFSGRHIVQVLEQSTRKLDSVDSLADGDSEDDAQDEDFVPGEAYQPLELDAPSDIGGSPEARNIEPSRSNQLSMSTSSSHPSIATNTFDDTDIDEAALISSSLATSVSDGEGSPVISRKRRIKRTVGSDDEEETRVVDPQVSGSSNRSVDSDAENQLPSANGSDVENAIPPKIGRVSSMFSETEKRGPLQPLASFLSFPGSPCGSRRVSSSIFSSPSSQPRPQPLAERPMQHEEPDDPQFGESDFGFGGMSQLFLTQKPSSTQPTETKFRSNDLDLATQPSGLLPALNISNTQRKRNDELLMHQEEDDLVLARSTHMQPRPNENRSFDSLSLSWTQLSPERMEELSNTQRLLSDGPGSSANSKLSLSPSTPTKRGKVVRGRENVSPTPSPASPPRSLYRSPLAGSVKARGPPRDAFQMLLAPKPRTVPAVSKEEIDRFYEGEAEESDDEAPFGLPVTTQDEDDDEADGEEVVKELVDDREMNEETEARQLVYEKHQELEKVDDEKNLKIAQNAVDGKFRAGTKRRRRGIDGAGSDSDGSDDEVVRRAKPPKRRNIAGDTLPDLAKDPATLPFFQAYQSGILADDNDLLPLAEEKPEESESEDDDEQDSQQYIGTAELQRKIREKEWLEKPNAVTDPDDISWLVEREDSQIFDVDDVVTVSPAKRPIPVVSGGDIDQELHLRRHNESQPITPQEENESTWSGPQQLQAASRGPRGGHFAPKNPRPSTAAAVSKKTTIGPNSTSHGLRKTESMLKSSLFKKGSGFE